MPESLNKGLKWGYANICKLDMGCALMPRRRHAFPVFRLLSASEKCATCLGFQEPDSLVVLPSLSAALCIFGLTMRIYKIYIYKILCRL